MRVVADIFVIGSFIGRLLQIVVGVDFLVFLSGLFLLLVVIFFCDPVEVIIELDFFSLSNSFDKSLEETIVRSVIKSKVTSIMNKDLDLLYNLI